jgi:hypothetical protein
MRTIGDPDEEAGVLEKLGVNLDFTNLGGASRRGSGRPEPADLELFRWARLIARAADGMDAYLQQLRAAGIRTLVVLDQDALGTDPNRWADLAADFAERLHPDVWQVGNEPDGGGASSSQLAAEAYGLLVRRAVPVFKQTQPDAMVISAGLTSGNADWLLGCGAEALALLDAVAVHLYGQRPTAAWPVSEYAPFGVATDLLDRYRSRYGRPLWVSEFGTNDGRAPDDYVAAMHEALAARPDVVADFVFCYSDVMVDGFGLVNGAGQAKPAYARLREALADRPDPIPDDRVRGAVQLDDLRGELPTLGPPWQIREYHPRPLDAIQGVTLHYTAAPVGQSARNIAEYQISPAAIPQTQAGQPFPAIAYTILVTGDGVPHLCHDLDRRVWHSGASTGGIPRNLSHVAICYTGDQAPNAAQIGGLATAIRWCEEQLGRPLTIEGHRDAPYSTSCPGPQWPAWRADVERELARLRGGDGPRVSDVFLRFLAEHPEWGRPRLDEQPIAGGSCVWTTPTAAHPKGSLLVYRSWLDEVRGLAWD